MNFLKEIKQKINLNHQNRDFGYYGYSEVLLGTHLFVSTFPSVLTTPSPCLCGKVFRHHVLSQPRSHTEVIAIPKGRQPYVPIVTWIYAMSEQLLSKKNFTSCDPHHDIYTFSCWQIFWHSI